MSGDWGDGAPDPYGPGAPEPGGGSPETPPTGGRAERRRAAQQAGRGGRRGGHGRRAAPSGGAENGTGSRRAAGGGGRRRAGAAAESTPANPGSGHRRSHGRGRRAKPKPSSGVVVARTFGELFMTFGVILLLFIGYQMWWTNVRADASSGHQVNALEKKWAGEAHDKDPRDPDPFDPGEGFAVIDIPKLDVVAPIAQSVDKEKVLDKGMVGHYWGRGKDLASGLHSAMPWQTGNFALAGHRNTHGEPFRYINKLAKGDKVVVETAATYYVYTITSTLPVTPPSNIGVVDPIPKGSGFTEPGRYLTLTTCTPEFTSTNRLIVWGKQTEVRPRSKGKPDALLHG